MLKFDFEQIKVYSLTICFLYHLDNGGSNTRKVQQVPEGKSDI